MDQARWAPGSVELVRTRFTAALLPATPAHCAQDLGSLHGRFAAIVHRLKLLWLVEAGRLRSPLCGSVGSPTSRWTRFSSNRGQVGGGNAASVRRGSTWSRWRMYVAVRRYSNYLREMGFDDPD
jgi:hypothetical protein